MRGLKYIWFGYLLPKINSSVEILDRELNPCVYSGKPPGYFKCNYICLTWFGLVTGIVSKIREQEDTDSEMHLLEESCTTCGRPTAYGNLLGRVECTHCDTGYFLFDKEK